MDEPMAYYCFEVLYWSGIREGELLALTPADIDLKRKTISVTKTFQHINGRDLVTDPKTSKSRRKVKIPDFLCEELRDYMRMQYELRPEDRLFPVTKNYLHRKMALGCQRQGMKKSVSTICAIPMFHCSSARDTARWPSRIGWVTKTLISLTDMRICFHPPKSKWRIPWIS